MPFLTVGFYFLFTKEFLELDDENPFLSKVTNLIGKGSILLFFAFSVFLFFTDNIYLTILVLNSFLLASIVLALILVIAAFRIQSIISNYFAIGTCLFMITLAIAVVNQILYLSNSLPVYVQFGIIIEAIVFSIGMSHKLKRDYEDHLITQQSLILQLTKADKIQKSKTFELEEIVADRTQRLKSKTFNFRSKKDHGKATKAKSISYL